MLQSGVVEHAEERPAIGHSTAYSEDPRLGFGSHRIALRPGRPELRKLRRVARNIPLVLCMVGTAAMAQQDSDDHAERMAQGLDVFRTEVQPLFASDCIQCHGHGQVMGGLDLTSQGSLMASGKIGDSAESSALVAVLRHERQPFMPFGQDKLSDEKIDAVARWVDLGAPYDQPLFGTGDPVSETGDDAQFWSFRPLMAAAPPAVADKTWAGTPIDRFILARLEAAGIEPNSPAGRRTLIRRASLDLLGLPPSPERVEEFANDSASDAYERLLDELLESPHYGERWARHWMDIARFADSYGFEEDYDRPFAYHYRDFLIKAFNRDMPYDRFVRLQVAGDELEPENALALMATGFMGNGPFPTQISDAEFEISRYDELDDMIGTLGTAMLGLTVGCARCHDHKHDPISARDYYRMAAIFGRTTRTIIEYDPDPGKFRAERAKWESQLKELRKNREKIERELGGEAFEHWLGEGAPDASAGDWQVLDIVDINTASQARADELDDGSILFSGDNIDFDAYTLIADISAKDLRALRIEALTHPSLPFNGPGRSHDGEFLLGLISVEARPMSEPDAEPVKLKLRNARATDQLEAGYASVSLTIDDDSARSGWALPRAGIGSDHAAIFDFEEPASFDGGLRLVIKLHFSYNSHFSLGRLRLSVTDSAEPGFAVGEGVSQGLAEALAVLREMGSESLTDGQKALLLGDFARKDREWMEASAKILDHESRTPMPSFTKIQATAEGFAKVRHNANGRGYPHFYEQTYVLRRGDANLKLEPAEPQALPVLTRREAEPGQWLEKPPPGWERSGFHRASLAKWLTDSESGAGALLARVIVNRVWHHHFGTGIVATPSNFGAMGARPTHPELLDWLAWDLVQNGWKLKRLHRLIMASSVYRVDASVDSSKAAVDSSNRLRWRWTPRRLEAEAIRDSMLAVSGALDPTMHGPGVQNESMSRRSVYFFVKRSELIPSMMLFDWPEHLVGIGRRPSTTIAPQALLFLNSPFTRRYARDFSSRLAGLELQAAVEQAYRTAFARPPGPAEAAQGVAFLERQLDLYRKGGRPEPDRLALVDYCQSLMSLNEFLYIR
ncbi:MAG: DUF1549 domain-containing protein [Acidobacteriia bacterium]|nr:DUF1549 domain-containing protein [Terriglobia bacterium]